ncbi:hypothetical protein Celaphus_00003069, partial [Cervus elaphus hippelaphus]
MAVCQTLHYPVPMNIPHSPRPPTHTLWIAGSESSAITSVMYTVITPMLSPFIYSLTLGVFLSSGTTYTSHSSTIASVMYTVVTPMLNPFIYSLRNRDIKEGLKR